MSFTSAPMLERQNAIHMPEENARESFVLQFCVNLSEALVDVWRKRCPREAAHDLPNIEHLYYAFGDEAKNALNMEDVYDNWGRAYETIYGLYPSTEFLKAAIKGADPAQEIETTWKPYIEQYFKS